MTDNTYMSPPIKISAMFLGMSKTMSETNISKIE